VADPGEGPESPPLPPPLSKGLDDWGLRCLKVWIQHCFFIKWLEIEATSKSNAEEV